MGSSLRLTISPVKTICMHGSPISKWDNRDLWKKYNYRDFGIIAEPYFDVDFDEVLYLTDTGRSWNKSASSVRDKVNSKFDIKIKDTNHLMEKIQNNELPDKIMLNTHPQRWTDNPVEWTKELVWQNVKNVVKKVIVRRLPQYDFPDLRDRRGKDLGIEIRRFRRLTQIVKREKRRYI